MKVLFACGGTAGHINPALAVATELRRRVPDCEILFVGNPGGMEATLVPRAGFRFDCSSPSPPRREEPAKRHSPY